MRPAACGLLLAACCFSTVSLQTCLRANQLVATQVLLLTKPADFPKMEMFPMLAKWKTALAVLAAAGKKTEEVVVQCAPGADAALADK